MDDQARARSLAEYYTPVYRASAVAQACTLEHVKR